MFCMSWSRLLMDRYRGLVGAVILSSILGSTNCIILAILLVYLPTLLSIPLMAEWRSFPGSGTMTGFNRGAKRTGTNPPVCTILCFCFRDTFCLLFFWASVYTLYSISNIKYLLDSWYVFVTFMFIYVSVSFVLPVDSQSQFISLYTLCFYTIISLDWWIDSKIEI